MVTGRFHLILGLLSCMLIPGCAQGGAEPDSGLSLGAGDRSRTFDTAPKLLSCPESPVDLRGTAGGRVYRVRLQFLVDTEGLTDPQTVSVLSATPRTPPEIIEEAREIAEGCVFKPALKDGTPVPGYSERTFRILGPSRPE